MDGLNLEFSPSRDAGDAAAVAAVGVATGDLHHFLEQAVVQGGGVEPQLDEAAVVHDQIVFHRLVAGVGQMVDLGAGQGGHFLGQFAHLVALGHLVEDLHPLALLGRVLKGQLHAAHRIADVDEGASLAAGAVHRERIADRRLHQEAVEHRAVVTVVVEAVGEERVAVGGFGVGAPDDALVQIRDPHVVVLVVVEEQQLIQRLRHVIHAARAGRVQDLFLEPAAVGLGHLHLQVALGNGGTAMGAVAIDPHGAQMHHVDIETALHDRGQQVMGAVDVVVHGVALGGAALHRVGRGPLLGEVHHRIGALGQQQIHQSLVLMGQVELHKAHRLATHLVPGPQPLGHGGDGGERLNLQVDVDLAAAEVVDDDDLVARIGQVDRAGPTAEAVAAENEYLLCHELNVMGSSVSR